MASGIQTADRLQHVGEYYFSRKLKEVAALRQKGVDVISLAVGSPDLPPHPSVIRALHDTAKRDDAHGYQSYSGVPQLRQALTAFYKKVYNVDLNADTEVLPLMGSKEGILHITMAFANPGDIVLVPDPGYATYRGVAKLLGVHPVAYNLLPERGWEPDVEAIERMDLTRVKIFWVNYPHMPTGASAPPQLFERLADLCATRGILLVNDNPYSLVLPNAPPRSLLSVPRAKECALELNSLSKSHNMPGWRVGVVCGAPRFVSAVLQVKSNFDSGMFLGLQQAAVAALTAVPQEWHDERNKMYAERRESAFRLLDALGCTYDKNQVGLFVWAKAPWDRVEENLDRILYTTGVFITPGSVFGKNGSGYLRVSLCCPTERIEEALARLRKPPRASL